MELFSLKYFMESDTSSNNMNESMLNETNLSDQEIFILL